MYEFQSKVRYSEMDSDGKLSLGSLLNYFQDCSTFQSEELGIGLEYLGELKQAWVLSAWQIVVERYPAICEKITIGTFPYEFKGFLGYRNFYLKDEAGKMIAYANSLWTLVNIETMKPARPTEKMIQNYPPEPKLPMDYAPRKITVPEGGKTEEKIIIRQYHLDTNHHVNNGQYIQIATSYLPEHFHIDWMRAEYKKPAFLNDEIVPYLVKTEESRIISLRGTDGQPYVNVEFYGKDRSN